MNEKSNYSVEIIRYTISQDQQSDFVKAYVEAGNYLKASKYCLAYEVIHGDDEPTHFIVIIHWTSKDEHLNGFRRSPEFSQRHQGENRTNGGHKFWPSTDLVID